MAASAGAARPLARLWSEQASVSNLIELPRVRKDPRIAVGIADDAQKRAVQPFVLRDQGVAVALVKAGQASAES